MLSWYKRYMKKIRLPEHIKYLLSVYLTGIAFFTLFRLVLFLTNLHRLDNLPAGKTAGLILRAFGMGFRFDTVVSGYILSLPFILLSAAAFFLLEKKWLYRLTTVYLCLLYSIAFLTCAIDIPYYNFFNSRLSAIFFNWLDKPGLFFKMTLVDSNNLIYIIALLLLWFLFCFIILKFGKKYRQPRSITPGPARAAYSLKLAAFSLAALVLLFIGIRGRVAKKSPIRVGTAYFSNYAFPNQLGLNPVFTFVRSLIDRSREKGQDTGFMDDEYAVKKAREYLGLAPEEKGRYDSPIARSIETEGEPVRKNVVIVLLESMSAEKMGRYGNPHNLTPNLDELATHSLNFDRIYTSGNHTANGIFSTLFGFSAIFKQHPLKPVDMLTYAGLPTILKDNGYATIFFLTHDDQFDNMGGFLRTNGFETVISQKDYPEDQVLSSLGVPDHYLFEFSIPRINELYKSRKPFLAFYLTASDHVPYIIPAGIPFTPRRENKRERIVEYVDWSIGHFMDLASQQEWFENTLFVFIADHGANLDTVYELPLSYFHTPLIFYSPAFIPGYKAAAKIGGQIDVFPTILGLLNIPYVNNSLGIDLSKEERSYIYFCGDDKLGCLGDDYFLVVRDGGGESLYDYKKRDPKNRIESNRETAGKMKEYLFSMMQTTRWLIKNRKVGRQQPRSPGQPRPADPR